MTQTEDEQNKVTNPELRVKARSSCRLAAAESILQLCGEARYTKTKSG